MRWRTPQRLLGASMLVGVIGCANAASAAARTTPLAPGVWEVENGATLMVAPGLSPRTVSMTLFERRPASVDEPPTCVATDVAPAAQTFLCAVPLKQCDLRLAAVPGPGSLTLEKRGATGTECPREQTVARSQLRPIDPLGLLARLYLPYAAALGTWTLAAKPIKPVESLGPNPLAAARQLAGWVAAGFQRRWHRRWMPSLAQGAELMRIAHHRTLEECGALAGSARCQPSRIARIVDGILDTPESRAVDRSLKKFRAAPVAVKATGSDPAGLWLGPHAEVGASSGVLQVRPAAATGDLFFSFADNIAPSELQLCTGRVPATLGDVKCAPCARRIHLQLAGATIVARLLGDGWRAGQCPQGDEASPAVMPDLAPYIFTMRRSDAFAVFASGYIRDAQQSDLGSSGGRLFYVTLGPKPEETVRALATRLRAAYARAHGGADGLAIDDVSQLFGIAHAILLQRCGGLPGPGLPSNRCARNDIDHLLADAVLEFDSSATGDRDP